MHTRLNEAGRDLFRGLGERPDSFAASSSALTLTARTAGLVDPPPNPDLDSGNPTVRDRRGACGNAVHGGTRNPPPMPKGGLSETFRLQTRAPQVYPDRHLPREDTQKSSEASIPLVAPCRTDLGRSRTQDGKSFRWCKRHWNVERLLHGFRDSVVSLPDVRTIQRTSLERSNQLRHDPSQPFLRWLLETIARSNKRG
jgi:hypothetical protein